MDFYSCFDGQGGIIARCQTHQDINVLGRVSLKKSMYSCYLHEIQGFIVGGVCSRFWLLRKHVNMMTPQEIEQIPFYSWECITILLDEHQIHLVISHEEMMDLFIKFLIHTTNTVDGQKNSATKIKETLVYQMGKELM